MDHCDPISTAGLSAKTTYSPRSLSQLFMSAGKRVIGTQGPDSLLNAVVDIIESRCA